jgi:acyl dehydratase
MSAPKKLPAWRLDEVSAAAMVTWVEALNDDNRIHVDPDVAEALGFGHRTVNPGPANLAYVMNMLMAAEPGSYPKKIEARFLGNVFSGDALEVTGEADGDGHCRATLRVVNTDEVALEVDALMEPKSR